MKKLIFLLMFILCHSAHAQKNFKEISYFGVGFGWGIYKPGNHLKTIKSEYFPDDSLDYDGRRISIRLLLKTKYLNSRIKIGSEYTWQQLAVWKKWHKGYPGLYKYMPNSYNQHAIQILADYLIFNPKEKAFCFHTEVGLGLGFNQLFTFGDLSSGSDQWDKYKDLDVPHTEMLTSVKLVASYDCYDAYISFTKTFTKNNIFIIAFGAGIKVY